MNRNLIERLLDDLPSRCGLFIPMDVAQDLFPDCDVKLEIDKIGLSKNCAVGFQQAFQTTPNDIGFRLTKLPE